MKNSINDLNNYLFEQLDRLADEDIKGDILKEEIHRAKAMAEVSKEIIQVGKLGLAAKSLSLEHGVDTPRIEVIE